MSTSSFGSPTDEVVSDVTENTEPDYYEGYEMTDDDMCYWAVDAPEHSRRKARLQMDSIDKLHPTELARLVTIGHVVAHGLNEIRALDTPLEKDPYIIYGSNAVNEFILGDIRDPEALMTLLNDRDDVIPLIGYPS